MHVHFAVKVSAKLDCYPSGRNIAGERATAVDFHTIAGRHISFECASDDHLCGAHARRNSRVSSNVDASFTQRDRPFDAPIDLNGFVAAELAPDHNRLTDVRATVLVRLNIWRGAALRPRVGRLLRRGLGRIVVGTRRAPHWKTLL